MASGYLRKMRVQVADPLQYHCEFSGGTSLPLNPYLGHCISLRFSGEAQCVACSRRIKKTFNQGYCYPCFMKLAACDSCIVKPEKCHFSAGTCREPAWGLSHCMQPHIVYIANSSGLKVGITRQGQIPTRWIDQGARQALAVYRVQSRYHSGLVEVMLKSYLNDKTNWRQLLAKDAELVDIRACWQEILAEAKFEEKLAANSELSGKVERLYETADSFTANYPLMQYPSGLQVIDVSKTPEVEGKLVGIKGQYLLFEDKVINIRKYTGYFCEIGPQN